MGKHALLGLGMAAALVLAAGLAWAAGPVPAGEGETRPNLTEGSLTAYTLHTVQCRDRRADQAARLTGFL